MEYPKEILQRPRGMGALQWERLAKNRKRAYERAMVGPVMGLFTKAGKNTKTRKSLEYGVYTLGLFMAPHMVSGVNLCSGATTGCAAACLFTSGRGWYNSVREGRLRRTYQFLYRREEFMQRLVREIINGITYVDRLNRDRPTNLQIRLAVRLNGTTDIDWTKELYGGRNLFERFPGVQFYDYTKKFNQLRKSADVPNYHMIWSRAETKVNQRLAEKALAEGFGVAVVFEGPLPIGDFTWKGAPVVDGDKHDAIFTYSDGPRVYALKAKGLARYDETGFVVPFTELGIAWPKDGFGAIAVGRELEAA